MFFSCLYFCASGWRLSDESIRAGLESAFLLGRNQILTQNEAERLGLPGSTIMLDGGWVVISGLLSSNIHFFSYHDL